MKIRSGFVSNSSSSSFCIFGIETDKSEEAIPDELLEKYSYHYGFENVTGALGIDVDNLPLDRPLKEIANEMFEDFRPHFGKTNIKFWVDGGYE